MYTVYILRSVNFGRHYVGHTENMDIRLALHNAGRVRATKGYLPWIVRYTEEYKTRAEAARRELEIKSYKGGVSFQRLLEKKSDPSI